MITANIYLRVFRVWLGRDVGTAFAIEVDQKQYIVIAKHLLAQVNSVNSLALDCEGSFCKFKCRLVGYGKNDSDIVVLAADQQLAPSLPVNPSRANLTFAQDVYF